MASVVYNTLVKYKEMDANDTLSKEQKLTTLRNAVEEATALEMPSLSQNLPIVATLTTLGTLVGLLGTVMGMIKSFQTSLLPVRPTLQSSPPVSLRLL